MLCRGRGKQPCFINVTRSHRPRNPASGSAMRSSNVVLKVATSAMDAHCVKYVERNCDRCEACRRDKGHVKDVETAPLARRCRKFALELPNWVKDANRQCLYANAEPNVCCVLSTSMPGDAAPAGALMSAAVLLCFNIGLSLAIAAISHRSTHELAHFAIGLMILIALIIQTSIHTSANRSYPIPL